MRNQPEAGMSGKRRNVNWRWVLLAAAGKLPKQQLKPHLDDSFLIVKKHPVIYRVLFFGGRG